MSAVAAAALMPLADPLVKLLTADELRLLLDTLWDALLELDELTASTSSILTLLSSLVAHPQALPCLQLLPLERLVPRLWPFLSHSSSQVRLVLSDNNNKKKEQRFTVQFFFVLMAFR